MLMCNGLVVERMYLNGSEIDGAYFNTVEVFDNNTGPTITLIGDSLVIFESDSIYVDAGATAYDEEDSDVTASIVRSGNSDAAINALAGPAAASVIFDAVDSDGIDARTVTRTVNVIPATTSLNLSWDTQAGDTTATITGDDMLYTNDGWVTWGYIVADSTPQTLTEGDGPYELRETGSVTHCRLSQDPGVSKFTGELIARGGENLTSMNSMFRDLDELTTIDLTAMVALNVTDIISLFNGCSSMTAATGGTFDTSIITDITGMFAGCESLEHVDFTDFDTSSIAGMASLFTNCINLVCLTNLDTTSALSKTDMFYLCDSLQQPSPGAIEELTDTGGAMWTNVEICPPTI